MGASGCGTGEVIEYCFPLGCENLPSAFVCATVAAAGWPYEFPRDGRREPVPRAPPVEGRVAELIGAAPKAV